MITKAKLLKRISRKRLLAYTTRNGKLNIYAENLVAFSRFYRAVAETAMAAEQETPIEGEYLIPKKTFGRKQLRASYLSRCMNDSTITLIARGNTLGSAEELDRRKQVKQLGFTPHRIKGTNLVAAAKYYNEYDSWNVSKAESFAKGHLIMLMYNKPLISLATSKVSKSIEKSFKFSGDSVSLAKDKRLQVIGAFIKDEDKSNPFIWMSDEEFRALIKTFNELSQNMPADDISNLPAHSLFQLEINRILSGKMSILVEPLEQQLRSIPMSLEKSMQRMSHIFMQLAENKRNQDK